MHIVFVVITKPLAKQPTKQCVHTIRRQANTILAQCSEFVPLSLPTLLFSAEKMVVMVAVVVRGNNSEQARSAMVIEIGAKSAS